MSNLDIVLHQLQQFFLLSEEEKNVIKEREYIQQAEKLAVNSLKGFASKYFKNEINPFNGVQYCNFLYWLSFIAYKDEQRNIADKVYYLNKMLNAVDLYYEVHLPLEWSCEHPLGSVMGKAKYGNHFFFFQGCTVGGSRKGNELFYPEIGENVIMYSNSKIVGKSKIGDNVIIAANTYIKNQDVPSGSLVFGESPNLIIKKRAED